MNKFLVAVERPKTSDDVLHYRRVTSLLEEISFSCSKVKLEFAHGKLSENSLQKSKAQAICRAIGSSD